MKNETYYVGDLCYVMHDVWNEVCDTVSFTNEDSAYELADGRKFFMLNTAFGDGEYFDQLGRRYGVDSGTLGAIKVSDIRDEEFASTIEHKLGQVVEMPSELEEIDCYADGGTLVFGTVIIETGDDPYAEDEEDYDYPEDEDEDA